MKRTGLLIVVSGPSGAGKGTICKELLSRNENIHLSVSATTRGPRTGEVDGVNYHFIDKNLFKERIEKNAFLEYAEVYHNFYGTPSDFVMEKINKGEDVLLEIDIQGALQVKKNFPEGVFVFILPPSLMELKSRIIKRNSETAETLNTRFSSAMSEIAQIDNYNYFIINDVVDDATGRLEAIIEAEKCRVDYHIQQILQMFKEEHEC